MPRNTPVFASTSSGWSRRGCLSLLVGAAAIASGAASAAATPDDLAFLANLTLLQGRSEAARELVRLGKADLALKRHLGSNLGPRIASLEPELNLRKLPALQPVLDALVGAASSPSTFEAAFAKADAAIVAAGDAIPEARRKSPKYLGAVMASVVTHAAVDYSAAVADGRIAVIKEFEEVYGYNRAVVALWRTRLAPLLGSDAPIALVTAIKQLEAAVPSPVPPEKIAFLPLAMDALAKTIEAETARLS